MRNIPILHITLFVLTFFTTLTAGALNLGINILEEPARVIEGFPFASSLMTILLCHEFAHYIASYRHNTAATLPYFIPAPSFIGTFGAFIKMKSPITTRTALMDIGASGPIIGFIASLIASIVGLYLSDIVKIQPNMEYMKLGDSILFKFLSWLVIGNVPEGYDIFLHPIGFAGWIGMLITSLNLLPIGQLDGGHITYALVGDKHRSISILLIVFLIFMGIIFWEGWLIWAVMMLILGINHPPVLYWEAKIPSSRIKIGFASIMIFFLTFIPEPFKFT
ncbi:MAG: site-2 protease family protein [Thermodesulfovibrionales bacterium]|nr:site-2 protease family protein [Thermodesulfovibrionales bacterium]